MNRFTRILAFAILGLLFLSQAALAATLEEAKAAGQIGEKQDGYIGLVQSNVPADVVALVESVNAQRRARYEQIAASNGIAVTEVAKLAFERAFEATRSGHFVESSPGQWARKP
jgi:uncharacterized protein YdbL (DUF1318 family)